MGTANTRTKPQPAYKSGELVERQIMLGHLWSEERLRGIILKLPLRSVGLSATHLCTVLEDIKNSHLFGHQWETFRWTPLCSTFVMQTLLHHYQTHLACVQRGTPVPWLHSAIVAFVLLLFEELASLTDHRFAAAASGLPLRAFLRFKGAQAWFATLLTRRFFSLVEVWFSYSPFPSSAIIKPLINCQQRHNCNEIHSKMACFFKLQCLQTKFRR